jgi:UDP-3-O-[3-hydroxymyristoyl] glucosamine N-acyltransferase
MPKSVVMNGCSLGDRVWLNPGAVVGGEGFGFAPGADGHLKIPQAGTVVIGDDVEVGANSCIDRAAMETTYVRSGAKLDNLVQVGHAADVGEGSLMVAFSGVAGSSRLGRGVVLAAKAAVLGHLSIGDRVQVGVASAVTSDVESGEKVTGVPAIAHKRWLRAATHFGELAALTKRVRDLEKRIIELEESP